MNWANRHQSKPTMIGTYVIIVAWTTCFACLNFFAVRKWRDSWELVRWIPTMLLVLWDFYLIMATAADPSSHNLWPVELFGVSLLSLIVLAFMAMAYDARTRWKARH